MDKTAFLHSCLEDSWIMSFLIDNEYVFIPICPSCNNIMVPLSKKKYIYRCYKYNNGIKCGYSEHILKNTIFWKSRLSFHDMFYILNGWRMNVAQLIISEDLEKDKSTISRIYTKMDDLVLWHQSLRGFERIGGQGYTVEVDECLLVKRKYNRGRILRGQKWIVGGVVRGDTSKFFIEFVPHRSRRYLLNAIKKNILPGTKIVTDQWAGYKNCERILFMQRYLHMTVNHSMFFVDPLTGENTQSVECFWSVLKRVLRKKGTNIGEIERRIRIFQVEVFKRFDRKNLLIRMLDIIREHVIFN